MKTRAEWGARKPKSVAAMRTPTAELWLHHTAGPKTQTVRQIQNFHMDTKRWKDIAYSFLVDDKGTQYVGRGPGVIGGHTNGRNSKSHAICVIGDCSKERPSLEALESIAQLVAHGVLAGWWNTDITGPHSSAPGANTQCCGNFLKQQIPTINRRAAEIVRQLKVTPVPVEDPVKPAYVIDPVAPLVDDLRCPTGGVWVLGEDGGVFAFGGAPFLGTVVGKDYWGSRKAARIEPNPHDPNGYVIVASSGETYGLNGF